METNIIKYTRQPGLLPIVWFAWLFACVLVCLPFSLLVFVVCFGFGLFVCVFLLDCLFAFLLACFVVSTFSWNGRAGSRDPRRSELQHGVRSLRDRGGLAAFAACATGAPRTGWLGSASVRYSCRTSRGSFPILSRDPSFQKATKKPWGNSWLLKRTMVEKKGESTPRVLFCACAFS